MGFVTLMFDFFKMYWKQIAVGILLMMALGYVGVLKYEAGSAKGKAALLEGQNSALTLQLANSKADYKALQVAVKDQNAVIAKLQADSKARQARSAAALAKAQESNQYLTNQAKWLTEQLAKPDSKECSSALTEWRKQP